MISTPRVLTVSIFNLAVFLGTAPAHALDFDPMLIPGLGLGTVVIQEVSNEPGVFPVDFSFLPPAFPFSITFLNTSSDTITSLDLEVGLDIDGVFQPGSDGLGFLGTPTDAFGVLPLGLFTSLSEDATTQQLDLSQAFTAANNVPEDGSPAGIVNGASVTLNFFVASGDVSDLDLRFTLNLVPEPTTLALALLGLGAATRRPLRRV